MGKWIQVIKWFLTAVLLVSLFVVGRRAYDGWRNARDSAEAAQAAGLTGAKQSGGAQLPRTWDASGDTAGEPMPEEAAALAQISLEALREVNGDVVGWIEIPGTELSYPLMQGADNRYYLSRSWKGEPNSGGSVFLESTNNGDLTDFHTIAYAHRMNNDSMFGTLKYYEDQEFWPEHPSVYLVTDTSVYRYDIFAAQTAAVEDIVYRLDLEEKHLEEEFLQYCIENSVIDTGLTPEAGDRILTLSTCTSSGRANRWVVHGVLAQEYSRERSE